MNVSYPLYFNQVNRHVVLMSSSQPNVALFVTCLVDLFRPSVGFATVKLMEEAGCKVSVPNSQTCCGQPTYNSGDRKNTIQIARQVIQTFEHYDYVVAPSGSCAGMIKEHYPRLFEGVPSWHEKSLNLASRIYELTSFLVDVLGVAGVSGTYAAKTTYHDSCSGLRELGIKEQPRKLLAGIEGLKTEEYDGAETCCGFGGIFCIKYSEISDKMATDRIDQLTSTGAKILLGGDLGCLINLAGKLKREGSLIQVRHVAEILAGMTDDPAVGEGKN